MRTWPLLLALWLVPAAARPATFAVSGGTLIVETQRYRVEWRDGCLTAAENRLAKVPITTPRPAVSLSNLPAGLGFQAGQEKAAQEFHHPWVTPSFNAVGADLQQTFPTQFRPGAGTKLEWARIPGGVRLRYRGLAAGERRLPEATLEQELAVDAATGDLVIRQRGANPEPGVYGVAFSLANVRPDTTWVVPYFGGQRWSAAVQPKGNWAIRWPQFWNAALAIGETSRGCFAVWAQDAGLNPKYLRWRHAPDAHAMTFLSDNDTPFDDKRETRAPEWRFNVFAGQWTEPAARYREWMVRTYGLVPLARRRPGWARGLSLVYDASMDPQALQRMAQVIDPRKVLLMQWGWLKGFNRRVPEYVSQWDDFAERVKRAHDLGYHVGAYLSLQLIDREAFPEMMREYNAPHLFDAAWRPDEKEKLGWLAYVHPGSRQWREFYVQRMREVVARYDLDYLYQDTTGVAWNSDPARVDGLNSGQAVVALESALRAALPERSIGGEFWNEVNVQREDWGIASLHAWGDDGTRDLLRRCAHPIGSFLFSDFCLLWEHQKPVGDSRMFHLVEDVDEVCGALPIWHTNADPLHPAHEAEVLLARAKLWAEGFRPYFPDRWEPDARAYLRGPAGRVVKYVSRTGSRCIEVTPAGEKLLYARVTGVDHLDLPGVSITGWVGCGPKGLIGLDPARHYCVFPRPAQTPVRLTALPAGVRIAGTRLRKEYALVELDGDPGAGKASAVCDSGPARISDGRGRLLAGAVPAGKPVDLPLASSGALLFGFTAPAPVALPYALPLDRWDRVVLSGGMVVGEGAEHVWKWQTRTIGGVTHRAYAVAPPLGGVGAEHSLDGFLHLPDDPKLQLRLSVGYAGGAGDGMHTVVRVSGREVWRLFVAPEPGWHDAAIPLGEFAGGDVLLSLAVDCGKNGNNTSNDNALWGDAMLRSGE